MQHPTTKVQSKVDLAFTLYYKEIVHIFPYLFELSLILDEELATKSRL